MTTKPSVACPYCGSESIHAAPKRAGLGSFLAFGVPALFFGSKKVLVTCLSCGKQWKPGEAQSITKRRQSARAIGKLFRLMFWLVVLGLAGLMGLFLWMSHAMR